MKSFNEYIKEKNTAGLNEAQKIHSTNPLYGTAEDPRLDITKPYRTSVADPEFYDVMKKSIASDTDNVTHNVTSVKTGERSTRRHPNADKPAVNTHHPVLGLKEIGKMVGVEGKQVATRTSEIALRALEKLRAGLASDPDLQRIYKDNLHGEPRPEKPK
jgi:hypothetical protein